MVFPASRMCDGDEGIRKKKKILRLFHTSLNMNFLLARSCGTWFSLPAACVMGINAGTRLSLTTGKHAKRLPKIRVTIFTNFSKALPTEANVAQSRPARIQPRLEVGGSTQTRQRHLNWRPVFDTQNLKLSLTRTLHRTLHRAHHRTKSKQVG